MEERPRLSDTGASRPSAESEAVNGGHGGLAPPFTPAPDPGPETNQGTSAVTGARPGAAGAARVDESAGPFRHRLGARGLAALLRGACLLAITGVCVLAFEIQLTAVVRPRGRWNLHDFVNGNQLGAHGRTRMLEWLALGALLGVVATVLIYNWGRRRTPSVGRAASVLRTGRLLWPLMLPGLAWPLLVATDWDALQRVTGIGGLALLAEVCFRGAAGELLVARLPFARALSRLGQRLARPLEVCRRLVAPEVLVLAIASLFYAIWMSWGTILQHRQFGTAAFDLGNYDTLFFNMLHGHPFRCASVLPKGQNWSMLSNHAELTMFALLPFYAIRPGAETLLVLQAVALACGAIPLYRFGARRLPRPAALVIALAYLLYAPMHQANFYDVHFQPFAVVFTLWAIDMLDARRPWLFGIFFLLAMGCREDIPLGFIVVGLYLLLVGRQTRAAIVMSAVALAYFVVIKFAVMPHFGSWWFSDLYKDLYPNGESTYGGVLKTILTNPAFVWKTLVNTDKIVLFIIVLAPLAFLPLRRRLLWMSLLPAIPFTMLTTGYGPTVQISFQYVLLYVPFLFLASALALAAYRGRPAGTARLVGALGGIAVATFLTTRVWGAMPPGDKFRGGFREIHELRRLNASERQRLRDVNELAAKIPRSASVAATEAEHPHVSTRLIALALRNGYEGADYILYSEDGLGADSGRAALASGAYEVVERRPASRLVLLRKLQK